MALRVATTFSGGYGSVEFALKYLDMPHEIIFACEWAEPQRKSYLQNHGEPTSEFYKDIRDLDGTKYVGQIDFLHQSPPCQSYSLSGNRGGLADERGGLMLEAIKLINDVQPKLFTVENVKGLLSSNDGEDWKNIIKDFNTLDGYTISWGVMNAKEQGTPQNRERVFIVGFRSECCQFNFPQKQPLRYTLKDLLENKVDDKYFLSEKMINGFMEHKDRHSKKGNGFGIKPKTREDKIAGAISCKAGNRATDNYILETGLYQIKSNTKKGYEVAKDGDGISLSRPTSKTRRGRVGKGVSQTLETSSNQGVVYEGKIRRLTPRECSRIQGDFEDKFILDGFSDTKLYEFIGNAMDISTTKNLISKMLDFSKKLTWNDAQKSVMQQRQQQQTLF